ncbi:MAG TPA: FAD binding domain-containing protein [Terriglobales bacterium]|nr:FAD binding domain-containing protein [Terriglobales bacterium]
MQLKTSMELQYSEPTTLGEAFTTLSKTEGAKIFAGGTDLMVSIREGKIAPNHLVNIKRIPGLDRVEVHKKGGLSIGALVTVGEVEASVAIRKSFPMLTDAAHELGSFQVRNRATLGGNLCNSSPSADLAQPLVALGAIAKIVGPRGRRLVKLEDFFTAPGRTVLRRSEILAGVKISKPPRNSHGAFLKHGPRQCMDIATVNAAVLVEMNGRTCKQCKIVLGAVAPVPMRAKKAEAEIRGKPITDEIVRSVAEIAAKECVPISDVRGSAEYRRDIVNVLVRRLFGEVLGIKMAW